MKRHENIIAHLYKPLTPTERYLYLRRGNKRRSSLQDGVVVVRFIKVLPPDAPVDAALPRPDLPPDYAKCIGCFGYFTRGFKSEDGQGMCDECLARLQSPVGALPPCEISNCTAEANYHYNGGHYCWQHRPAPDYCGPERPEQWPGGAA